MLHFILSLRLITLVAALGAALGALLMFAEGCAKLVHAMGFVRLSGEMSALSIIAPVMQATDAILFGLVLIVFAFAITFGFAFDLPAAVRAKLPLWMRVDGISELKVTLMEVILVYLVVDFATDVVEVETRVSWHMLVKPVAIFFIACALRLLGSGRSERHLDALKGPGKPVDVSRHQSGDRSS